MITVAELKKKAASRYESTLRRILLGENPFPVSIPYKRPQRSGDPATILRQKNMLRDQSKERLGFGPTVQFNMTSTRRFGSGSLPGAVTFDTLEDLTQFIGKQKEAQRIIEHAKIVTSAFPEARVWTATRLSLLSEKDGITWHGITRNVAYFIQNPKPWAYARELPLSQETKFLERNHKAVLEILTQVAPTVLNQVYTSWQDRLGLRSSSELIEGRFLDPALAPHLPQHMLAPISDWNRCAFAAPMWVLITENRTTLLTLPFVFGCVAFLGKGFAVTRLAAMEKLQQVRVFYWGDIDQHGFEILASIREVLPNTLSCLMDEETLAECQKQVGMEDVSPTLPAHFVADHLTTEENILWQKCRRLHLRLEQERIDRELVIATLGKLAQ